MTRAELLAELRVILGDTATPYAWTDARLTTLLSEGQDQFCEDTGYFKDRSTYSITLESGTADYDIDDRIIEIYNVWDGTRKLEKLPQGYDVENYSGTGDPTHWQVDAETGELRLFPTPTDDEDGDSFTLQCWRYSVYELTNSDTDGEGTIAVPELPGNLQRACALWAAYTAVSDADADSYDADAAERHRRDYYTFVRKGKRKLRRLQGQHTEAGVRTEYNCW